MTGLRAAHYDNVVKQLKADPIVVDMAAGLPNDYDASWSGTHPSLGFMMSANGEYSRRGGTIMGHIGAVAEALVELTRDW